MQLVSYSYYTVWFIFLSNHASYRAWCQNKWHLL